jgi:copper chaperone CopZ
MKEARIKVGGMNCNHCKINVENRLGKIPGVHIAIADIADGEVTIKGDTINLDQVKNIVEDLGYIYNGEIS